ncbi:NAD(P)/FAD-dependent oxidoreductase [Pullulanibacillus sp. KACC 23026]|uniref:NAD(P)/FAD-dependent oxidoreductase n=1 Tax=Pullulanibacillus sp. KACC 23026 TaxID=3028315 RepID=UPI0023B0C926|nr:NAD(P)/FAD-dependent oxidoreductase [Pullulanibacillus sp. KACC 23026]WEG13723.1 NAD(P)/FAD-dependent oxidoreductase [Pullulanibacillus sp. KACC 23026]
MSKHIVILGAGYGGLLTALTARNYLSQEDAYITVVNQYPTHQIITELHRLAAGNVTEQAVTLPLEKLFKGKNIDLKIATVASFDVEKKSITLNDQSTLSYDYLVVGLGSTTAYFGIPGLEENSFVLKSAEDALNIQKHVENRIRAYSETGNKADATILIGGGGLTGIELVGELADILPGLCKKYGVKYEDINLSLVEAGPKVLPVLPDNLIERATESLAKRGVNFITGVPVTNVEGNVVDLKNGEKIETNTFVWTGGVQGHPLVGQSGLEVNRGRATVNEHLQSTSHKNVFVVGDSAVAFPKEGERPYAPTAQNSWQMGELVGYNLFALINDKPMDEFNPVDSGTLASLGRKDGVAIIGGHKTPLKGFPATMMKEASNLRYLSHINGLFTLAY